MNKYFLLAIVALSSLTGKAQFFSEDSAVYEDDTTIASETPRVRKYPARLWEISGNGLKQPSYLYGTMHVSKKLAFNLGDTFYKALQSADVVALELSIDSWLSNIGRNREEYNFSNRRFRYGNFYNETSYYKSALSFKGSTLSELLYELRSEDYMSNFLLYRTGYQNPDFSEKTYVDLYIHQVGKKSGKYCTGLEDFEISRRMVNRSDWRERTLPRERSYSGRDYFGYGEDPTERAYREGDLDMIDSMEKKGADVHFLKWMLYERNKVMADKIHEIVKTKRLFAAVGCAHLPGDSGVIEFLRRMGYTLTPIYDNVGDYAFKQKQKLETTNTAVSFKKYVSHTGELTFELPGEPLDRSFGGSEDIFYADVANGAYYVLKKIYYYGNVKDISQEKLLKQIDSALYENIPGDITSRSKSTMNGFPVIDVSNRTKTGETQRHMYIILPDHVWYIKLNAPGDYAAGKEARDFFKSIAIQPAKTKWGFYEPESGGYRVYWPSAVVQNPVSFDTATNLKGHIDLSFADEHKNYYFLKTIILPYYGEDADTFHMHQIAENYAYYNKGKVEKISFRKIDGHEGMECVIKFDKKDRYLHLLLAADDSKYYALGVFNSDKRAPQDYLEKFSFTEFKYKYKPVLKTDVQQGITYKRPDWKEIERDYRIFEEEKDIAHKEIKYPAGSRYGYSYLSQYFKDTLMPDYSYVRPVFFPSGEAVNIQVTRSGKIAPESNFKYMQERGVIKNGVLDVKRSHFLRDSMKHVSDSLFDKYNKTTYVKRHDNDPLWDTMYMQNGFYISESISGSKDNSWLDYNKRVLGEYVSYDISTRYDKTRGLSPIVKDVIHSVKFEDPKMTYLDSQAFGHLMVKLLSSTDSLDIFRSLDYRSMISMVPASFNDTLLKIMEIKDKNKMYGGKLAKKIENKLRHDNYLPLIPYYMDKYRKGGDTSEIQANMLSNLGELKNEKALDSLMYWLLEETPLSPEGSYNSYAYSSIINTAHDTLELWKSRYKRLLPLTRYNEYEDAIMSLGLRLLDSSMIDSTVFLGMLEDLTLSFRDDLKRKLSKSRSERSNYWDEGYSEDYGYGGSHANPDEYVYGTASNNLFGSGNYYYPMDFSSYRYNDYIDEYDYEPDYGNLGDRQIMVKNIFDTYDYSYYPPMSAYNRTYTTNYTPSSHGELYDKARILVRFYHQNPDVSKRLSRVYKLQDRSEKMQYLNLYLRHKISMPDTMYQHYLKGKENQYGFVQMLKKYKLNDSIPKNFFEEKNLVNSFVYYEHFEKKDTVVFLGKKPAPIENETGTMYFYKHRNKENKSEVKGEEKWYYSYIWVGEKDTLNTMKMPRYFNFNNEMPKKQSVKDMMNMEVSKLQYWRHPLWEPLAPEDEEKDRYNPMRWGF